MINSLKTVFKPCVRSEADIDAWIDQGKPFIRGKSLYTSEEFVVNLAQVTVNVHSAIATAAAWYRDNAGMMTEEERESGLTYDVSIVNEDEYEIQFVFDMRRKFIIDESSEVVDVYECTQ